jgi:hypothetical protein
MALACLGSRAARLAGEPLDWVTFILFEETKTSNGFDLRGNERRKSQNWIAPEWDVWQLDFKSVCNRLGTNVKTVA